MGLPAFVPQLMRVFLYNIVEVNKMVCIFDIMKLKDIIPYLLAIVLGILLARECNRDKTPEIITITRTISIPPISGWFEPKTDLKPVLIREVDSTYKEHYLSAKDSLERLQMYLDAITIREYKETFKDTNQEINVFSRVRGEMLAQNVDYKIFGRKISQTDTIEIKNKRHFYLLPQAGYNPSTMQIKASGSLIYQDRKNRLYSLGYDTSGAVLVGYGIKF